MSDTTAAVKEELQKLDPKETVVRQKERLLGVFEAALARADAVAA